MKLRVMICAMAASVALFADDPTTATFGLIRVSDTASSNTVIGVPWKNIGDDGNVTLSNLVSTANLDAGDIVYLYESETWLGYQLSASGVWEALTTVNGTDIVNPQSADAKRLERGSGLIIQRAHNTNPIYLCGRLDDTTPSATAIAANTTLLFANPLTTTKTISSEGANGDQIRMLKNAGGTTIYEKKDGVWGTYVESTAAGRGGRPGKTTKTWTPGCTLAPGIGAWYVSGEAGTSITWGN
ncbi:MAG: hypothetical protein K6A95_00125 [Bacteroidales bacterium]|nr:hypothetical protein [Bacteroidales bacterium]